MLAPERREPEVEGDGEGLCTLSLRPSSSPRELSPTFETDYRAAVANIPLPAVSDVAEAALPSFYDTFPEALFASPRALFTQEETLSTFLGDLSETLPIYWDPRLLDEVLVLVSPSVFPEGPPSAAEVASTSGLYSEATWITAVPFYDVDVDIKTLSNGEEQHIWSSPAASVHHNLDSPVPWLSRALVRSTCSTRVWPAGTAATQLWDWRFVLHTSLQFLAAVVAQAQGERCNRGRYFAGLHAVATEDGHQTLRIQREVFQ